MEALSWLRYGSMRKILIYTCERCGIEFSGRNKRKGRILCPKCTDIEWEAQRRERKRAKSRPQGQSLAQVAAEARAHGMTYGQWAAARRYTIYRTIWRMEA